MVHVRKDEQRCTIAFENKRSLQFAQNRVQVALLKSFLFTLRLRSRYLKGTPELALYASKKIGTIRCTDRIILKEK